VSLRKNGTSVQRVLSRTGRERPVTAVNERPFPVLGRADGKRGGTAVPTGRTPGDVVLARQV